MSDSRAAPIGDPFVLDDLSVLCDTVPDRARVVTLATADPEAVARAMAALANSRGGDIVVGAACDAAGRVTSMHGVDAAAFERAVVLALTQIDPPISHLVSRKVTRAGEAPVGVVRVRLSPSSPHLLMSDGGIYRTAEHGVEPIRSRRTLDDLYARGRGERERGDRLVDAMVEKLVLAHYAFYSLAVVACTHTPSGEPYRAAVADPGWLAAPDDPFIARFGLHEHEPSVSPGELELRTPGEVNAFVRITRSGCVAVGEVQRRPYHDELDTAENMRARFAALGSAAARLLSPAADALILPHVFVEGVRGLRLVLDAAPRRTSGNAPQDTVRFPLSVGDARDAAYVQRLPEEAMERLAVLFPEG